MAVETFEARPDVPARRRIARTSIEPPAPSELVPVAVLLAGVVVTALSFQSTWIDFAYRLPRMQAVIDTAVALSSLLLAYLVYGRVEALMRRRDLVLAFALGFLGLVNLFGAMNDAAANEPPSRFGVWTPTIGNLFVALLFAAAAGTTPRPIVRTRVPLFVLGVATAFVGLMALVAFASSGMPWSPDLTVPPDDATKPAFVGPAAFLAAHVGTLLAYSGAAIGFSRLRRNDGELMTWVASSCMLFAFASFTYLSYPSIFSDRIYVGDVLRLAAVTLLLAGAAREIRGYWKHTAAIEERRALARDLHDGVAQELAFIATAARRLEHEVGSRHAAHLADAAQHALDESRLVISALAGAGNTSEQLALTARDAARRFGLELELDVPSHVDLPANVTEALLRITREAITNTGRHASARTVRVSLATVEGVVLTVADDGAGFDAAGVAHGFGLVGMRERAAAIGADFSLVTGPRKGTTIRVVTG
jgi:signal transduction histidine kinase